MLTLVHCADVHLETSFPDVRGGSARRAALTDAFIRIIDEACRRKADVLSIGGDLYESERAGPQTMRFLCEQFARFERPVFVAPGNHDPWSPSALLARGDLPPNVRIFDEAAWRAFPLSDEVTLYGFGHTPAEPGRPFANARFDRGKVRIALVHGSDDERCPPNKRATAPFRAAEVEASGASTLLTGHYHGGYTVARRDGTPLFAYPGSPEPVKFGETGTHGALIVTIEQGHVAITTWETAQTRLLERSCDLGGATNEHDVLARTARALDGCGANDYVKLKLSGVVAPGTRVDPELLSERLGALLGALDVDDRTIPCDYDELAREPTVRGRVVTDLLEAARGSDPERAAEAEKALRYAVAAFEGTPIVP
ncbi:MAG TPA: metallophosphoesterase [Candidatus Binatia bacterium]|nr:metallophosphoesterase [Candidatus Binatia bacterium]